MTHIYRFILSSLLLLHGACIYAHLSGQVVDEKGNPLIGANVVWAGTGIGTVTNLDGVFEVEPIRQTKYLVASYVGYRSDTILVRNRDAIIFSLVPDNEVLDEVTVTERKLGVIRSRYEAFDTQTLGAAELCKAACCNMSEAFETNASVDVAYADAATGAKQIKLLGLSGTYVQLLGENCPAVRGLAQNFGMEFIPGPWMESIQVSKGTSSVINGYEAITGQINVEYLKPQTQDPVAFNLYTNTELHAEANFTGGWDIPIPRDPMMGSLSTGVLAFYKEGAFPMDDNRDGFLDMPTMRNLNLLNRWYYKNDRYTFQFLLRGLHDERHGGQRMGYHHFRKPDYTAPDNPYLIDLRTDRIDGFMKNGFIFDPESGMSLGIIAAFSYHDQENNYGNRLWRAAQGNLNFNAIFQNTWEGGEYKDDCIDHKLSAGLSLNYDHYRENLEGVMDIPAGAEPVLSRQEAVPGLFAEYNLKVGHDLSMVAGLRGDYSTLYRRFFATPRLNLRYTPWDWWTIRTSIGLGYRSPNMVADYANFLPSNRRWLISPLEVESEGVRPAQERSMNVGATMTWDIPMGSRHMQLSAEYYYTHFFNCLVADADRDIHSVSFFNLSDVPGARSFSHNAQIEASMEVLRGWTWTAAFRYADVRQTSWNSAANEGMGAYELRLKPLTNQFKAVITTSYQTPLKTWQFDLTAQFNGGGRMPDGFATPAFLTDARASQYEQRGGELYYRWYPQLLGQITKYWRTCSLYVGAENMTNFRMAEPVVAASEPFGTDFDASMTWGPTTGWKVYIGFRWNLPRPDND